MRQIQTWDKTDTDEVREGIEEAMHACMVAWKLSRPLLPLHLCPCCIST
jgi:hypothetical protein